MKGIFPFLGTLRYRPLVVDRFSSTFSSFFKSWKDKKLRCKSTDKDYQFYLQITHFIENNLLILASALSTKTSVQASPTAERSPTDSSFFLKISLRKENKSHSFGRMLSPGHCRRKNALPVSYYALFQGIAASKRTSWLFQHSHILFHLAFIWGP